MAIKRVSEKTLGVSPSPALAPSTRKAATSKRTPRSVEVIAAVDAPREPIAAQSIATEDIAALAYSYWLARGCQGGSPEQDWLRAERELRDGVAVGTYTGASA